MGFGVLFLIFFVIGIYFVIVRPIQEDDKDKKKQEQQQQILNAQNLFLSRQNSMNQMILSAQKNGFSISKIVYNYSKTAGLAVDTNNRLFLVKPEDAEGRVLNYSQLVSYELCKDGKTFVSGDASSAIIGGLLFGTVGAIVGAAGSTQSVDNYCSQLYISIVDNNAHRYKIPIISKTVSESSETFKLGIEQARDMLSILDVINSVNTKPKQTSSKSGSLPHSSALSTDKFEAIKKYKELLDMGIITQEEFNAKKNELLAIDTSAERHASPILQSADSVHVIPSSTESTERKCIHYNVDQKYCKNVCSNFYRTDCYGSAKHLNCTQKREYE